MAFRSPLPGSRPSIPPSVLGQRGTAGARQQNALFRAREARRERVLRVGAGYASPQHTIQPGETSAPEPITVAQRSEPATLLWSYEFRAGGGGYPAGTIWVLDEFAFSANVSPNELVLLEGPDIRILVDLTDVSVGVPPFGIHTYVMTLVPDPAGLDSKIRFWINGRLADSADGLSFTEWSGPGTWRYSPPSSGLRFPLEVFPGYIPASFVA